jgi:hypothetical protein
MDSYSIAERAARVNVAHRSNIQKPARCLLMKPTHYVETKVILLVGGAFLRCSGCVQLRGRIHSGRED